jgi:hypothetical protein
MRQTILSFIGCSLIVVLAGTVPRSATFAAVPAAFLPTISPQSQVMQALKVAHKLLSEADHDYQGHRHLAAEEVHKAIDELGHHHHKSAIMIGSTASGILVATPKNAAHSAHGKTHKAQAVSDGQLQQAQQLLERALIGLSAAHPKAAANVHAAISQINMALSVR